MKGRKITGSFQNKKYFDSTGIYFIKSFTKNIINTFHNIFYTVIRKETQLSCNHHQHLQEPLHIRIRWFHYNNHHQTSYLHWTLASKCNLFKGNTKKKAISLIQFAFLQPIELDTPVSQTWWSSRPTEKMLYDFIPIGNWIKKLHHPIGILIQIFIPSEGKSSTGALIQGCIGMLYHLHIQKSIL